MLNGVNYLQIDDMIYGMSNIRNESGKKRRFNSGENLYDFGREFDQISKHVPDF